MNGKTLLSGSGTPSSGTGTDGDFYINTALWVIHGPKASGSWPAGVSLIGGGGNLGFATTVGDGSNTTFTVTHGLGTRDVLVLIRQAASPYNEVYADVAHPTVDTVSVTFGTAPSTGEFQVVVIAAGGAQVMPGHPNTNDYCLPGVMIATATTLSCGANLLKGAPIFLTRARTFDRIAIEVTTQASAGNLARLGIYRLDANWAATLVLDAGTVAIDSLGVKEITINQTLSPGTYMLAVLPQASVTLRSFSSLYPGMHILAGWGTSPLVNHIRVSQAYGALPSSPTFGLVAGNTYITSVVALRATAP